MARATLSVVIVTHDSRGTIGPTLAALERELGDADELIVVDNASRDGTPDEVRRLASRARVIETGKNLGFSAACNRGAADAAGELLVLLNPDAVPAEGWREAIARPLSEGRGWKAWQALVTQSDGRLVNTRGGVVHFTGIAWAGGEGEAVAELAAAGADTGPGFVSGACLAIPRIEFERLGRLPDGFFLYHEDVDLSLRVRLAGGRLGVAADARVDHDYDFDKGAAKWRRLERNRWATLIRTYPARLLFLLAPALAATELALLAVAAAGGWLPQKLAAWADVARALPRLLRERRAVRALSVVSAADFARGLTSSLDSPNLGRVGRSPLVGALLRAYWSAVLRLLGASR